MTRKIDIQGHRGARGLFPENTLEGFLAASALGVTAFELDVGMTADGVLVVTHDPALNPDIVRDSTGDWLDGRGPTIWSLTYAQLTSYDVGRLRPGSRAAALFPDQKPHDGARIPSLAAALKALPDTRFTIEIKTEPSHPDWTATPQALAEATLNVIDEAKAAGRVIVEAFDWRVQRHIRRVHPAIRLAWLTRPETTLKSRLWWDGLEASSSVPAAVAAQGGPVWAPDHTTLTEAEIAEAHTLGLFVLPWTVNQPDDMRRLIAWGVDGLISDRPDLALDLVG
ncbi:MAG TPA: glycerophosphodiester phosphodiesterase [Acetobacteraceae bacterium]|jgi:glycerophosphoryl diester phosphodiesterase|nr:glycerophosphodiester phosphodiesterase [Acetobacteraceae bacterium]